MHVLTASAHCVAALSRESRPLAASMDLRRLGWSLQGAHLVRMASGARDCISQVLKARTVQLQLS
jgi:hypothetical protein